MLVSTLRQMARAVAGKWGRFSGEETGFLATVGAGDPLGVHPLPSKVQERAARCFLGED